MLLRFKVVVRIVLESEKMPVVKPGDGVEDKDVEHVEVAVGCDRDKV